MSSSEERGRVAKDRTLSREKQIEMAKALKDKGQSNASIAHIMQLNESSVRELLKPKGTQAKESNVQIEGPYSMKSVDGLKTPVYIFLPGGEGQRKHIGEATVSSGEPGMTFAVELNEPYKDIETAHFDVPMRYVYLNRPDKPRINWRHNCLTPDIHDGRPGAIWNIPLGYAVSIFSKESLQELVIERIYSDAMQFVEASPFVQRGTDVSTEYTQEWAEQVKYEAERRYPTILQHKVGELSRYYKTPSWELEQQEAISRLKENKLNPYYEPLHSHDTINLLCRILGVSAEMSVGGQ
jgi:hypothetical protein